MKQTAKISGLLSVCLTAALIPVSATEALSCIAPIEYIPTLVESTDDVTIFVGDIIVESKTGEQVTHLDVAVTKALKGDVMENTTVQYEYDETWGYLCTNAPASVGETEVFITRPSDDTARYVTYSFPLEGELNAALTTAIEDAGVTGTILVPEPEPEVPETTEPDPRRDVLIQIVKLLQALIAQQGT